MLSGRTDTPNHVPYQHSLVSIARDYSGVDCTFTATYATATRWRRRRERDDPDTRMRAGADLILLRLKPLKMNPGGSFNSRRIVKAEFRRLLYFRIFLTYTILIKNAKVFLFIIQD